MLKIVKPAGLLPGPGLFNNLRASRETELVEQFPIQAVTAGLRNSPKIALKRYLQTKDEHFTNATQSASGLHRIGSHREIVKRKSPEKTNVSRGLGTGRVVRAGLEIPPQTSRETQITDEGNAESNAFYTRNVEDVRLQILIEFWPTLSEHLKERVLSLTVDEVQE